MCQECEPKFELIHTQLQELQLHKELLEQRIATMEQHHPIMDANTEEALEVAEEALEQAEEAQLEAQVAGIMAVAAASEASPPEWAAEDEEEELSDADDDTGTEGSEAGIRPEEGAAEEDRGEAAEGSAEHDDNTEPVVIQLAADKSESAHESNARRYRFARGRAR